MPRLIAKFEDVPFIIMNELAKRKVYMGGNCSFTYNIVKPGPFNPPHSHEKETQYVFVLKGTMRFIVDGAEIICNQGDMVTFERRPGARGSCYRRRGGIEPGHLRTRARRPCKNRCYARIPCGRKEG